MINKSYRILIVEDEEIECNALTMMLKYNRTDISEIRSCTNGIQALDVFRTFQPEIVLMDINLPGINGLEVIREIKRFSGNTNFAIISAHSQFAYAQEAIRLDVHDFLVKPVRLEDINRVIDSLVTKIEQARSIQERVKYQQSKMDAIRPVLESDCIMTIAAMRSGSSVSAIFELMQLPMVSGFVFTIRGEGVGATLLRDVKMRMKNMGIPCLGEIVNSICVCVAICSERVRTIQLQEIMNHLSQRLCSSGHPCQIGVGSIMTDPEELHQSYEQAMMASRSNAVTGQALTFHDGTQVPEQNTMGYVSETAQKITQAIRNGDQDGILALLKEFFVQIVILSPYRQITEHAYGLYILIISNFPEENEKFRPISIAQMASAQDPTALRNLLYNAFLNLIPMESLHAGAMQPNQIVANALNRVKHHYYEDITLDQVAEELNISVFYLSKLFRKHMGINFTEYLTQLRIDHAKHLLQEGNKSIKEVAYAVGFNSQSYFSKIFKKYTGTAPSEYTGSENTPK